MAIIAIFPMVFAAGVGGEVLAPMALPVLGGLLISDEVVDLFLPVRFFWVRRARWLKLEADRPADPPAGGRGRRADRTRGSNPAPAPAAGDGGSPAGGVAAARRGRDPGGLPEEGE